MESTRPLNSPSIMAIELPNSPANTRAEPLAQSSCALLNGDCWRAVGKHLSARDVVRLSQVDQYLWRLFPRTRKLLNTLVERYYGSDKESQKRWRCALEKIPWDGLHGRFRLWQNNHLHEQKDRDWVNSDPLRQRALFRYLSSSSGKIPRRSLKRISDNDMISCITPLTGDRLATGSYQGTIKIWHLTRKTGQQCLARLTDHSSAVNRLRVLDNGQLVSASNDNTLKIWDLSKPAGRECIMTLPADGGTFDITVLPDYRLVSTSSHKKLIIWDLTRPLKPQQTGSVQTDAYIRCLDALPNGQVVCGCGDGTLKILDLSRRAGQEPIAILKGHTAYVCCLVTLPDGKIASGSYDKTVKIWNPSLPPDSRCISTLVHSDSIHSLSMLLDGRLLANLVIWDLTRPYPEYAIGLLKPEFCICSATNFNGQVISHDFHHLKIWYLSELIDSSRSLPDGSQAQQDTAICADAGPVSSCNRSQTRKRKADDEPAGDSKYPKLAE